MKPTPTDFLEFTERLVSEAARFDIADIDEAVGNGNAVRIEVLRHFVERWLEQKIPEESALRINELTMYAHNIDANEILPELTALLSDKRHPHE